MRRTIVAAAAILMLSATSIIGVAAQDESAIPDEMPTQTVPVDVALLEALCEANAPDDAAKTNCLAVVNDILAATPAGDYDMEALGQAYLLATAKYNAKWSDATEVNERKQSRRLAELVDKWRVDVEAIEFPPAVQVVADRLIKANGQHARLLREFAGLKKNSPASYETKAEAKVARAAVREASQEMCSILGRPPVSPLLGDVCSEFEREAP